MKRRIAAAVMVAGFMGLTGASAASADTLPPTVTYQGDENCSTLGKIVTGGGPLCSAFDSTRKTVLGVKTAPDPQSPTSGVGDYFPTLRPVQAPEGSPFAENGPTMFASSGLNGFLTYNFDTPGIKDIPAAAGAATSNLTSNNVEFAALTVTGGSSMLERYAYNPTDLMDFLGKFAGSASELLRVKIWLPFTVVGLLAATVALLATTTIRGNIRDALWGVCWALVVLGVSLLALTQLIPGASYLQRETTSLTQSLTSTAPQGVATGDEVGDNLSNGGVVGRGGAVTANPFAASNAATDAVIRQVHYAGWCRRTFGSAGSEISKEYCPRMWEAQRYTFAEQARIDADQSADNTVRTQIDEAKAKVWNDSAAEIQKSDPEVYRNMQGLGNRIVNAVTELGFALAVALFRIFAALLLLMGVVRFVGFGLAFIAATPVTVIAKLGENIGKSLMGGAFVGFLYAAWAGVCSWLFGIWTQVALRPEVSAGWSFILMLLGTFFFWSLLRPDRKLLALMSFGAVSGKTKYARRFGTFLVGAAAGAFGGATVVSQMVDDRNDKPAQQQRSEDFRHENSGPVYIPQPYAIGSAGPLEGTVMPKSSDPVHVSNPDVYVPTVIPGETVPDSDSYSRGTPDNPTTVFSWDATDDVDLYIPPLEINADAKEENS